MNKIDEGVIIAVGIMLILLCLVSTFPLMIIAEMLGG